MGDVSSFFIVRGNLEWMRRSLRSGLRIILACIPLLLVLRSCIRRLYPSSFLPLYGPCSLLYVQLWTAVRKKVLSSSFSTFFSSFAFFWTSFCYSQLPWESEPLDMTIPKKSVTGKDDSIFKFYLHFYYKEKHFLQYLNSRFHFTVDFEDFLFLSWIKV